MIYSRIKHFFAQRHTLPFRDFLPNTATEILARESFFWATSQNWRVLKRFLFLYFCRQTSLLSDALPPAPAKILWLNPSSTSIGDSLMELAGRALLHPAYTVDLYTDRWNASLYQHDSYFNQVITDPTQIKPEGYDFVLLDLFNTRSIRFKQKYCPTIPFASLQGYFYGPDFNRLLFSVYRIHQLLGYPFTEVEIQPYLSPQIFVERVQSPIESKCKAVRIALAVGGVDPLRTYQSWELVLNGLWQQFDQQIEVVLLGSANGEEDATRLKNKFEQKPLFNLVNQLSLTQTAKVIAESDFFIGADGGLMHIAAALLKPGVALFGFFRPELRLGPNGLIENVFAENQVNDCLPSEVIAKSIVGIDGLLKQLRQQNEAK